MKPKMLCSRISMLAGELGLRPTSVIDHPKYVPLSGFCPGRSFFCRRLYAILWSSPDGYSASRMKNIGCFRMGDRKTRMSGNDQ